MSNINHNMPSWGEYEETREQRMDWPTGSEGRMAFGKFSQGKQYLNRDLKEQNIYQGVKTGKNILGGESTHGSVSAIRNYQKVGSLSHAKWFIMLQIGSLTWAKIKVLAVSTSLWRLLGDNVYLCLLCLYFLVCGILLPSSETGMVDGILPMLPPICVFALI